MKKERKEKIKTIIGNIFYLFVIFTLTGVFLLLFIFVYFSRDLPRPERYDDRPIAQPTTIYDRSGENVLYTIYGEEKRELTSLDNVPDHFIDALLVAEDRNFYEHIGIDFRGILRSAILNLREGRTVAGGSTISQQFVRSSILTTEREIIRKVREIVLTLELERRYPKEDILEFYLNQIPFGSNAYGIESAAQTFFNKTTNELSLAESAILVSVIPAPTYFSPYGENVDRLEQRKERLLNTMYSLDKIEKEELEEALEEEIEFHQSKTYLRAPHFIMMVKEELESKYGEERLYEEGFNVYTSIDYEMQLMAEEIVKKGVRNNAGRNSYNASMTVIDPHSGEILAMVGSADYFADPYPENCTPGLDCMFDPFTNVALRGRQPGSAFKPFVYATAFQNGYSGYTTVMDEQTNFGTPSDPYIPRNYDGLFRGEVTLRDSLAQSLNVPSVKVLKDLAGLEESVENARRYGMSLDRSPQEYGLPLVLGAGEVKLKEMTSAYGVFATEGYKTEPISILKITDQNNNIIEQKTVNSRQVMQSNIAKEITSILSDNNARAPVFGFNSPLNFPYHEVAVKTGSTQRFRDAWCIGYTSDIVVGVWTGNNDNTSMINAPGVSVAAPIWRSFMEYYLSN